MPRLRPGKSITCHCVWLRPEAEKNKNENKNKKGMQRPLASQATPHCPPPSRPATGMPCDVAPHLLAMPVSPKPRNHRLPTSPHQSCADGPEPRLEVYFHGLQLPQSSSLSAQLGAGYLDRPAALFHSIVRRSAGHRTRIVHGPKLYPKTHTMAYVSSK